MQMCSANAYKRHHWGSSTAVKHVQPGVHHRQQPPLEGGGLQQQLPHTLCMRSILARQHREQQAQRNTCAHVASRLSRISLAPLVVAQITTPEASTSSCSSALSRLHRNCGRAVFGPLIASLMQALFNRLALCQNEHQMLVSVSHPACMSTRINMEHCMRRARRYNLPTGVPAGTGACNACIECEDCNVQPSSGMWQWRHDELSRTLPSSAIPKPQSISTSLLSVYSAPTLPLLALTFHQ
jgi:hypothetical protein